MASTPNRSNLRVTLFAFLPVLFIALTVAPLPAEAKTPKQKPPTPVHALPLQNPLLEPQLTEEEEKTIVRDLVTICFPQPGSIKDALVKQVDEDTSAAIHYLIGNFYAEDGDAENAIIHYDYALEKFPNFLRATKNAGLLLSQNKRYHEALPYLQKAIVLEPTNAETHAQLATAYLETQQPAQAQHHFSIALEIHQNDTNAPSP